MTSQRFEPEKINRLHHNREGASQEKSDQGDETRRHEDKATSSPRRQPPSCYDQACLYLARRDHSEFELRQKLERKGYDQGKIEEAIASLLEGRYIDDASYCGRYARGRVNRLGLGPRRVRVDLMRKGFAKSLIEAALVDLFSKEETEHSLALQAATKKARSLPAGVEWSVMKKKIFDYLLRRGFSHETARRVALDQWANWAPPGHGAGEGESPNPEASSESGK